MKQKFRFASGGLMALAATLWSVLAPNAVHAQSPPANPPVGTRVETPINSLAGTPGVAETLVSLYEPLPASYGAHPAACDWNSYVRFRDVNGPADSPSADAIFAAQPGFGGGPEEMDIVARNTVMRSSSFGRHVEVWVQDHRWNCLIDRTGLDAAVAAQDYHVAVDYYFNNKPVNGQTYSPPTLAQQQFLNNYSLNDVFNDWYDIMVQAVPDQSVRQQKIFCGGHSYGGVFTSLFAAWGLGSDPKNPNNAGYQQCAGFWAIDSVATSDPAGLDGKPVIGTFAGYVADAVQKFGTAAGGVVPTIAVSDAELQAFNTISIMGLAAFFQPDDASDLLQILSPQHGLLPPQNPVVDLYFKFSLSRTYGQFLTNIPSYRNFNYTNAALLGEIFDNNSDALGVDELGLGTLSGPLGGKDFPFPSGVLNDIPFFGSLLASFVPGEFQHVGPTSTSALYTWNDYNTAPSTLPNPLLPGLLPAVAYTKSAYKMTDIHQWSRSLFEATPWLEQYYPINIAVGLGASLAEARSPSQADQNLLYPDGILSKPRVWVWGTAGIVYNALGVTDPFLALINPGAPLLPVPDATQSAYCAYWYSHLDISTGAYTQNDGSPETVSLALTNFAIQRTGGTVTVPTPNPVDGHGNCSSPPNV